MFKALKSYNEGGIPIGGALVSNETGEVLGASHNMRVQKNSPTLHGEMAALEKIGRLSAVEYQNTTMVTTLSPCSMCSGAIVLYKIPRVVIAENETFMGAESWLRDNGVEIVYANDEKCKQLLQKFIDKHPEIWNEDIGVPDTK